ncbi:MAG: ABC transporter substrate-binding protein [Thiovulaceae bacterium]|nr:ABC transporter substrate-binding protein [Sulfurimonadaceae bacterium]
MPTMQKLFFLLFLSLSLHSEIVNEKVEKVFGSSPPMNYLLYALNPEKMIGLNFNAKNPNNYADATLLDKKFLTLPVIGSFHGGGVGINLENILKHKPDLILLWEDDLLVSRVQSEIAKTKIPTLTLPFRKITDMPSSIKKAGEAIGEQERGQKLGDYAQKIIEEVANVTQKAPKKVRYYYAEGIDGLSTECSDSFHVEAHNFAGGENAHKCTQSGVLGLEKITFETLLGYDPDVIVVQNALVYNEIVDSPLWKHLRALKTDRVYLVPNNPFNWIDRPPSFMRVLGIQWLAHIFYPDAYAIDIKERTKEFYELFLNVKLTENQLNSLLGTTK